MKTPSGTLPSTASCLHNVIQELSNIIPEKETLSHKLPLHWPFRNLHPSHHSAWCESGRNTIDAVKPISSEKMYCLIKNRNPQIWRLPSVPHFNPLQFWQSFVCDLYLRAFAKWMKNRLRSSSWCILSGSGSYPLLGLKRLGVLQVPFFVASGGDLRWIFPCTIRYLELEEIMQKREWIGNDNPGSFQKTQTYHVINLGPDRPT